jgi:hypothetical protein
LQELDLAERPQVILEGEDVGKIKGYDPRERRERLGKQLEQLQATAGQVSRDLVGNEGAQEVQEWLLRYLRH